MKKEMEQKSLCPLTRDEKDKLHGGFSTVTVEIKTQFGATNSNCAGGGWFDSNINCTGMCTACHGGTDTSFRPARP